LDGAYIFINICIKNIKLDNREQRHLARIWSNEETQHVSSFSSLSSKGIPIAFPFFNQRLFMVPLSFHKFIVLKNGTTLVDIGQWVLEKLDTVS